MTRKAGRQPIPVMPAKFLARGAAAGQSAYSVVAQETAPSSVSQKRPPALGQKFHENKGLQGGIRGYPTNAALTAKRIVIFLSPALQAAAHYR